MGRPPQVARVCNAGPNAARTKSWNADGSDLPWSCSAKVFPLEEQRETVSASKHPKMIRALVENFLT